MKPIAKAAATSAALSALFLVVYPLCNWINSLRTHIGSCSFSWERHIPFVPAMILPYMSIDLFFIASPFLARSDRQLRTLALRITMAILVAAVGFLLLPLKFSFARPHVDGWLGEIFNTFRSVDPPFNEFPSLHIALCLILADIYLRRSTGLRRWLLAVWFALITLSPLLTYQHHMIDILGGFTLGVICLHLVADQPLRQPALPNFRIAAYYAGAAILLAAVALASKPWTIILLWPALSLALVSAGYFHLGPGIYRKQHFKLPWTTWFLLWPALLGQRLSLLYYSRHCRPSDQLTPHLWIGRHLTTIQAQQLRAAGVTAVLDLTDAFSEPRPFRDLPYLSLPILDLTAPTPTQIKQSIAFIERHTAAGIVYLHCKIGYSRTAAIAGAYLLAAGQVETVEQALPELRKARPSMIVRPEALVALQNFQSHRKLPATSSAEQKSCEP